MRNGSALSAAILSAALCLLADSPAPAADHAVDESTLSSLGLGGMTRLSDADGLRVRGRASSVSSIGTSFVMFFSLDAETGSTLTGVVVNHAGATDSNPGNGVLSSAAHQTSSSVAQFTRSFTTGGITRSVTIGPLSAGGFGMGFAQ